MAKRSKKEFLNLPGSTMIEVVATTPGKDPIKKEMTIDEANQLPRKKGWTYIKYELGFSSF